MSKVKAEIAGTVLTLLGYDGTDFYNVLVDVNGRLQIDVIGSALPAGAATEAKQDDAIDQLLLLQELRGSLLSIDADRLEVDVRSSELPDGAATELTLAAVDGHVDGIEGLLGAGLPVLLHLGSLKVREQNPLVGFATEGTLATVNTTVAGRLKPRDLNIEAVSKDLQVDVKSSALPTGAATSAKQTTLQTEINKMTDIRYQGDHILERSGSADAPTGTTVTMIDYTVPANKVVYVIGWGMGIFHDGVRGLGEIAVGASVGYQSYTNGAPLASVGVCFGKAVATEHIYVRGRHEAGVNAYINGWFLGIIEDA